MTTNLDDHALVIGIDAYPNYLGGRRDLEGAVNDARAFADWLADGDTGGGLPAENIHLLVDVPLTKDQVDRALEAIATSVQERGSGRRLYFFAAAHGQSRDIEHLAVMMPGWNPELRRNDALDATDYLKVMRQCLPFEEYVSFFDCCRAGTTDVVGLGSVVGCPVPRDDAGSSAQLIGFAAEFQRQSHEGADRGAAGEGRIVQGYFTTALLEALDGHAAREEGGVTVLGLRKYLGKRVPRLSQQGGVAQQPKFRDETSLESPLVLGSALPKPAPHGEPAPKRSFGIDATHEVRLLTTGDALTHVRMTDADDRVVYDSSREVSIEDDATALETDTGGARRPGVDLRLVSGDYLIVASRLGATSTQLVRVDGDGPISFALPVRVSPIPVEDSSSSREYYAAPAVQYSRERTRPPIGDGHATGSLFVMVRRRRAEARTARDVARGLELLAPDGTLIASFAEGAAQDDDDGWAILSADAAGGQYVLSWTGHGPRNAALWVSPGKETRVFLHVGRAPEWPTAALQMPWLGTEFQPSATRTMLTDAALAGLQSGIGVVDDELLDLLLREKFEDSMLGLVGGHHLLAREERADAGLVRTVLDNVAGMLGGEAPDVQGLAARAAMAGFDAAPTGPLKDVPMLWASADALYRWAARESVDVVPGSPLEDVATVRLSDSPWSTWTPLERRLGIAAVEPEPPDWLVSTLLEESRSSVVRTGELRLPDTASVADRHALPRSVAARAVATVEAIVDNPVARQVLVLGGVARRASLDGPPSDATADRLAVRFREGDETQRATVLGWMATTPALRHDDVLARANDSVELRLIADELSLPLDGSD